jgi:hypothetical protein
MRAKKQPKIPEPGSKLATNCQKHARLAFAVVALLSIVLSAGAAFAQDTTAEQPQGEASDSATESATTEIPMDVPEPESANAESDQQNAEDEIAQVRALKTLHRYKIGSIQKQRMLADVRKKAIRQGLSGQRLATHMRGAKLVIDSVGEDTMSLELKAGGKLLFNQGGRTKVMSYRVKGNVVEVDKGDGSFHRFAQFNGGKSTLSLLDPVYGKETVAVLQK